MAIFLLDAFVFVEMLVIAGSLVWIARTAKSKAVQALLPMIAILLLIATLIALPRVKGDGDGLYAIGLIPFSLVVLLPVAALTFAAAAWFPVARRSETCNDKGRLTRNSPFPDRRRARSTQRLSRSILLGLLRGSLAQIGHLKPISSIDGSVLLQG